MSAPPKPTKGPTAGRRALVIEDQNDTRAWLIQTLVTAFDGIAVAGVASRAAALAWLRTEGGGAPADSAAKWIALIDLGLPDGSGLDIIREIDRRHGGIVPIVTTIYDDDQHLFDAIAAGAQGYLLKDQHPDMLVQYLHRIDGGEPPLSPSIAQRMLKHFARLKPQAVPDEAGAGTLTAREIDVLRLLGRGLRVAEAARVLGLTPHTIAGYVKNIYRKLNISSRAEAAIEASRRGLT